MPSLSWSRAVAASTLLTVLLAACGGSGGSAAPSAAASAAATNAPSTASPAASAEASVSAGASLATTGRIEVADKGFAVTLPDGWTRIDLTADDLTAILEAAGAQNADLAAMQSEQLKGLVAAGLVVFAFGPDAASGTNLNILALPAAGVSLDLLEQVNKAQVTQLADGDVVAERVTLPAGDAIHFQYAVKSQGTDSPTIDQYLMLAGDQQLVVSVTSGTADDARAIAESIELLD